eukprot:2341677-Heterocapsa_arctica.AAC.1
MRWRIAASIAVSDDNFLEATRTCPGGHGYPKLRGSGTGTVPMTHHRLRHMRPWASGAEGTWGRLPRA